MPVRGTWRTTPNQKGLSVKQSNQTYALQGRSLKIEVFFDFVCPWCLIGKRHLNAAMKQFAEMYADVNLSVTWRSHQLLPDIPSGGVAYQAFYVARLGSAENVAARRAQVKEAGRAAGIDFRFERIDVMPNTAAAHNLIAYAAEHGDEAQQADLIESLFVAYFVEGKDIGDLSVLEQRGLECGLERGSLIEHLEGSNRRTKGVMQPGFRIGGVPLFVFGESSVLSGAASPDALLEAMLQSLRE